MNCPKCGKEIETYALFCKYCGKKQIQQTRKKPVKSRGNGQGSVYRRGKTWTAIKRKYVSGQLYCETKGGFPTRTEALEYLPVMLNGNKKSKCVTVKEIYDIVRKQDIDNLSKSKQCAYGIAYRRIQPIEIYNISDLTLSVMQELVDDIPGGTYPKRDVKNLLSKIFEYAMIDDYIAKNIARYITIAKEESKEKIRFSNEEIERIANVYNSGTEYAGFILIMIYCGIRTGEMLNIKCADVNLEKHIMFGGIKTEKGKNSPIFISDKVYPIIEKLVGTGQKKLYPHTEDKFYEDWKQLKENLNLNEALTPNCSRHTCATLLAEANIPPAVIMDILRHTKYDTSLIYTHIDADNILSNINKI